MNPKVEVISNTNETRKGIKFRSGKQLDELPQKIVTGENNARRIHINDLNHVQDEGEGKYREDRINLVRVVHDKEMLFNDEKIDRNRMHLPSLFEAELQELNEEMLFSLDLLE